MTETGISLARDENGNIIRNLDGTAKINNDFGYQTQTLVDEVGLPILDSDGNEQVQLAIQNFTWIAITTRLVVIYWQQRR